MVFLRSLSNDAGQTLQQQITPKLEKLRKERTNYLEHQKAETEMDRIGRLVVAHEYQTHDDKATRLEMDLADKSDTLTNVTAELAECDSELADTTEQMRICVARRETEESAALKHLQHTLKKHNEDMVRLATKADLTSTALGEEVVRSEAMEGERADVEKRLEKQRAAAAKLQETHAAVESQHQQKTEQTQKLEELLQTMTTGMAATEGQDNGYQHQLQEARSAITVAGGTQKQLSMRLDQANKSLKEKMPRAKAVEKENSAMIAQQTALQKEVACAVAQLEKKAMDVQGLPDLQRARKQYESERIALSNQRMQHVVKRMEVPPGVDRNEVKGFVATLFEVAQEHANATKALEIAAGARLYNVRCSLYFEQTHAHQVGSLYLGRRCSVVQI